MPNRKLSRQTSTKLRRNQGGRPRDRTKPTEIQWLYGLHTVRAALANPARQKFRLLSTGAAQLSRDGNDDLPLEILTRRDLNELLPPGAVHQGVALEVAPLDTPGLDAVIEKAAQDSLVVLLDQASDPRNIGAVMRSAAAFGAAAVLLPDRHTPDVTGILAKAASGALDRIPLVRLTNVARTLAALKKADFWCVGLDSNADTALAESTRQGRNALVIGAEGRGLRRLTAEKCDTLSAIPMAPGAGNLNLSAAAAIALYELRRKDPSA